MHSAPSSLFNLLLGPLKDRSFNPLFPDTYPKEDFAFVEGLRKALEIDALNGATQESDKQAWLNLIVERLVPPKQESGSTAYSAPTWPLPGQPWSDHLDADPREALIARLIHLGADPWAAIDKKGPTGSLLGGNVAGALLAQGHIRLFSLCMQLPQFQGQSIEQTCPSDERGQDIGRTYLGEAVFQDAAELTKRLIQMGANMDGVLFHARSADMASLLLDHDANVSEKKENKAITTWWLEKVEVKQASLMIKIIESKLDPMERFDQAAAETPWKTVKDALDAMPGWEEMTRKVGDANVRLPLSLLMKSTRHNNLDQINHALRMEVKAPFDDRIVTEGISEQLLARLTLERLIGTQVKPIQVQAQLAEKMGAVLKRITGDVDLQKVLLTETQQFLMQGNAFRNTSGGGNIVRRAAAAKRIIPNETDGYAKKHFGKRTLDDLNTINRAVRLIVREGETKNISDDCYKHIVGYGRNVSDVISIGSLDHRKTWLDRLAKQHPDRLDEVASGAMALLHFQISSGLSNYGSSSTNKDVWGADVQRIERLLEKGARLDITQEQALQFQRAANSKSAPDRVGGMQEVIRFAEGLPSLVARQAISAATAPVRSSLGPSKRL
jgi:hypothetical protein